MQYANGAAAVPLIAAINYNTNMMTAIGAFTSGSLTLSSISVMLQPNGTPFSLNDQFTTSEAASVWNCLWGIYQARLTTANAQLAALPSS
jgi:hypothetical protein